MHPRQHAASDPDKPAVIMAGSGESLSYSELEARANRGARLLRAAGLERGDAIAMMVENRLEFFEIYWAAQRSGLFVVPLSTRLTAEEAAYIVNDSGAKLAVLSAGAGPVAQRLTDEKAGLIPQVASIYGLSGLSGAKDWNSATRDFDPTPREAETAGVHMVYSSGTTGRPKGVRLDLPEEGVEEPGRMVPILQMLFGVNADTVYLSPAPLYHTAPLVYCTTVQRIGGTVVVMEKFEPEAYLAAVQEHRATFSQLVPTMFSRMLKLPEETRDRYDLSSLQRVVHAAAPCPVEVKRQMIEWWGPIIMEYYAGSEGTGSTFITSEQWLEHPGSVGRPVNCRVHICGEDGAELPPGETGMVYFESQHRFEYLGDPQKTRDARHPDHADWTTLGDVGRVDGEGYLYLTDRASFMIITGGVNVYPQEVEDALILHPEVADVAVFGVPNEDFGEEVKAVVQPEPGVAQDDALRARLADWCTERLADVKRPRSFDFTDALPRHDTGKLYKRKLRDAYWQ